jgi:hypothetical protein
MKGTGVRNLKIARQVVAAFVLSALQPIASAQGFTFVHPSGPPSSDSFQRPPAVAGILWNGPHIGQANSRCWSAEPTAPTIPIGGSDDWQKLVGFVAIEGDPVAQIDNSFRQSDVHALAGGGATSELTPTDLPPGIFVSVKAHPVFKVTRIRYLEKGPALSSKGDRGVAVEADFLASRSMGECYFYFAVWEARRAR